MTHRLVSTYPRWRGGRTVTSEGYVKVRVGREHPWADSKGYIYEHLLVWLSAGKPAPKDNELIHHQDEDPQNNLLGNLRLKPRDVHSREHAREQMRGKDGRFRRAA